MWADCDGDYDSNNSNIYENIEKHDINSNISLNNTLCCISGSHKWGKLHKPKRFDGTDLFENDNSEDVPDMITIR